MIKIKFNPKLFKVIVKSKKGIIELEINEEEIYDKTYH